MENFEVVNEINPITEPIKNILDTTREKFSKGIPTFTMTVKIRRFVTHIDDVINEVEKTTNLVISRSKISGLGLSHKDDDYSYWLVRIWSE